MKPIVAIVAGGDSSEWEVSLKSADGILSFIHSKDMTAYLVVLHEKNWNVHYGQEICSIDRNDFSFCASDGKHHFDFAYITIHGTPGENGILQGYFDAIGMPYSTGGVLVESLTFNKFALNAFLRNYQLVHISDSILVRKGDTMPDSLTICQNFGLPLFVKPAAGGSSFGVTKVKKVEELHPAIIKAFDESDEVMIEKMMVGTEITCGAYRQGNEIKVFPITEVVTDEEFFTYDAKYNGKVREITPARIAPTTAERVAAITTQIYKILNCYGIIRIDYILSGEKGKENIFLLEINTTPGMTATSFIPQQIKAAGWDAGTILSEIIQGKLKS